MSISASRSICCLGSLLGLMALPAIAKEPPELLTSPLAKAFGSAPIIQGSKLSPDGTRLSSIQVHPSGVTLLTVTDLAAKTNSTLTAGEKDVFDIAWCDWANDVYLLCGLRLMEKLNDHYVPTTRLISISSKTAEIHELVDRAFEDDFQQYQDQIIDWIPDDPDHVLIERPFGSGYGVGKLDIISGSISSVEDGRESVYEWITDGHGVPRLYRQTLSGRERWYVRDTPDSDWRLFNERQLTDLDAKFNPIGFGENRNELLYFDRRDGRMAIFATDLANGDKRRPVYSNPNYDVTSVQSLGKYSRVVAAIYADEALRAHFFDTRIEGIDKALSSAFRGMLVDVLDEDWNQRYYLLYVSSAEDPGAYYRYDSQYGDVELIARAYPLLADRKLIAVSPITYPSADGASIPAYITAPGNRDASRPAVVLPHGGPSSRDYWTYDFLAQFLAANGYVVLQSNYRGSSGYGDEWRGEGGFQDWRRAVEDIHAGYRYLVDEGIADPDRVCAVGWSYGAYAALMSTIEHPDDYQCVVSIAGVTDPRGLAGYQGNFVGGLSARTFIGDDDEVIEEGSPVERAKEIAVPVLLIQGREDVTVPFSQADVMQRALKKAKADYELVEYDHAEHSIRKERYRTDLLARLARFLDAHTSSSKRSD